VKDGVFRKTNSKLSSEDGFLNRILSFFLGEEKSYQQLFFQVLKENFLILLS